MNRCESCGHEWDGQVEVCPACATVTHASDGIETVIEEDRGYTPTSPFPSATRQQAEDELEVGTIFAGRYRIENLLGRGGMGIVYRAEDQTLGQTVALKFLPAKLRSEQRRVDRFLGEVRHAREIAHQNVCRVYDVGEAEGRLFLSMEYIDGEDLSTLLRRIGRLPEEKATDIARQLCSGLEALHENGMLHRDLKPANVMLDGRGRVRITDFGLAGLAADISGADIRSGTPQYMSPEQLEGREVSARSDVYALGLVLYEVFTGKPAFEADTIEEFRRKHLEERPASMGSGKQFGLTTGLLTAALWLALLLRAGLLALVTAKILVAVFLRFPVTTDLTQIHGRASMLLLALAVGLMVWALFQAVGGRQLVNERRTETLG